MNANTNYVCLPKHLGKRVMLDDLSGRNPDIWIISQDLHAEHRGIARKVAADASKTNNRPSEAVKFSPAKTAFCIAPFPFLHRLNSRRQLADCGHHQGESEF